MVLWQCFQTQTEIRDRPYVGENRENLSRVLFSSSASKSPLSLLTVCLSLCLFEPASHGRRPSLIIENGLPLSWVVPSLLRPRHWLPVPQAGEAHLVLQPWHGALALLGMDAHTLHANLVKPAFLYSLHWYLCAHRLNTPLANLPLINKLPFGLRTSTVCFPTFIISRFHDAPNNNTK